MNREIKFRAWNNKEYKWEMPPTDISDMSDVLETMLIGWADIILMQYTGLKDKNGVEIYEGDIVSCYRLSPGDMELLVCDAWQDGELGVTFQGYGWTLTSIEISEIKLVGNKYENPELLEPTNE